MKFAVKKPPQGQHHGFFGSPLILPKVHKRHYPAAASHCHAISLCPVIPYCHGLGIILVSYPQDFCTAFRRFLPFPVSYLKKEGKCGTILLPWVPDFRLQGGTSPKHAVVLQHFSDLRFFIHSELAFLNQNSDFLKLCFACPSAGLLRN